MPLNNEQLVQQIEVARSVLNACVDACTLAGLHVNLTILPMPMGPGKATKPHLKVDVYQNLSIAARGRHRVDTRNDDRPKGGIPRGGVGRSMPKEGSTTEPERLQRLTRENTLPDHAIEAGAPEEPGADFGGDD